MSMTEEKTTDRMQTGLQKEAAVQPEEKSKIVYEGGGNLARQQKKGKSLVLDDGRIEAMKELEAERKEKRSITAQLRKEAKQEKENREPPAKRAATPTRTDRRTNHARKRQLP